MIAIAGFFVFAAGWEFVSGQVHSAAALLALALILVGIQARRVAR